MARIHIRLAPCCLLIVLACASTSLDVRPAPPEFRDQRLRFFVENHGNDKRRLDQTIAEQLKALGFTVTSGFAADRPPGLDVLIVYEDRWQWDMSNYLIFMRIDLRDPGTNVLLGSGASYQTSLARKDPDKVIAQILPGLFDRQKATH